MDEKIESKLQDFARFLEKHGCAYIIHIENGDTRWNWSNADDDDDKAHMLISLGKSF